MELDFSRAMYSDPAMRPHLKNLYEEKYSPIRERIAAMPEGEGRTISVRNPDGTVSQARELSANQYEAMIPTFDKWLDMQSTLSPFDFADRTEDMIERAQRALDRLEKNHPDSPSGVRAVFSQGDQILGYVQEDGSLVTHSGGAALRALSKLADDMNLGAEARIAFFADRGAAALSTGGDAVTVTRYDRSTMPSKRDFAAAWYPNHNVDTAFADTLSEARRHLAQLQQTHDRQEQSLSDMRSFLLNSIQAAQD